VLLRESSQAVVAHICSPSYSGSRDHRKAVKASLGLKKNPHVPGGGEIKERDGVGKSY
jgi:hypothetical protein